MKRPTLRQRGNGGTVMRAFTANLSPDSAASLLR